MAAAKGTRPPNAGKGRKAGTPNKVTAALKDMVLNALASAGGEDYLVAQAKANPTAFLTLVGKVLPLQAHISGPDGGAIPIRQIINEYVTRPDASAR